jgi:hypothetical protein
MISETLEDQLTALEPPYETMEELKIGRTLDQYGIPFFYRQPTVIMNQQDKQNEIYTPSFTLPQYGCSVIEYIPNAQEQGRIIKTYRYNQIPAVVLGPTELNRPHWQQDLYKKIEKELKVSDYSLAQLLNG